jgi:hypothetical protein
MKYQVTRFKSPAIALKEIEPFVRDGRHLLTGKPFKRFGGLRSREILGNWLICAVVNANAGKDCYTFTSDPQGGDGVIVNVETNESWLTEHVMVGKPRTPHEIESSIECRILHAYSSKIAKGGSAYAAGKNLIIFLDAGGHEWHPRKAAQQLPGNLVFSDVWIFGLLPFEDGKYVYVVSQLGDPQRAAPTWLVRVDDQFTSWNVELVQ